MLDALNNLVERLRSANLPAGSVAVFSAGALGGQYAAKWHPDFQGWASWLCLGMMFIGLVGALANFVRSFLAEPQATKGRSTNAANSLPKRGKRDAPAPPP